MNGTTTPEPATSRPSPPFTARVLTLFPEAFPGVLGLGLHGKALAAGLWRLEVYDLRAYGQGTHQSVDAPPYGGGAGMVLRPDVLAAAIDGLKAGLEDGLKAGLKTGLKDGHEIDRTQTPLLYLSPRATPLTQEQVRGFASGAGLTLLCGRYEGVDQRLLDEYQVEEVSLGDFVLSGGEVAALALLEAVVRLLPGVLGNETSETQESFSEALDGLLEYPQFTRPAEWRGRVVPKVLQQGNHQAIAQWQRQAAEAITKTRRPDLLTQNKKPKA